VKLAESGGRSVAQVARELGMHETTLHRWMSRYGERAGAGRITPEEHEELIWPAPRGAPGHDGARYSKKSGRYLLEGTVVRYSFIRQHRGQFRLAALCRVLQVAQGLWEMAARMMAGAIPDVGWYNARQAR